MDLNGRLIGDLGRLAEKYPPADWRALLEALNNRETRDQVTALLEELMSVRSRPRAKSVSQSSIVPALREQLAFLEQSEPDRARILNELWLSLRSKELLPDMASLRRFAEALGMKELVAKKRDQALPAIVLHLTTLPQGEFDSSLTAALGGRSANVGEDYGRWVEMILGDRPSATEGLGNKSGSDPKKD